MAVPEPEGMANNPLYGPVLRLYTGVRDDGLLAEVLRQFTVEHVAHAITAPTALLQGGADVLLAEGAHKLRDAIKAEAVLHFVSGDDHALTWAP